jgi:hypothetical protein
MAEHTLQTSIGRPLLLLVVLSILKSTPSRADDRAPIPTPESQQQQFATLRQILGRDEKPTTPERDSKAIRQLQDIEPTVLSSPDARYVVLQSIHSLALSSGNITACTHAASQLAADYEIDAAAMISSDTRALTSSAADENQLAILVDQLNRGFSQFGLDGVTTLKLLTSIEQRRTAFAVSVPSRSLTNSIDALKSQVSRPVVAKPAATTELPGPDAPASDLKTGIDLFANGQSITAALPYFVKCGDTRLEEIAKAEPLAIGIAATHAQLAELWWQFAESQPGAPRLAEAAKRRAAMHYQLGRDEISGLQKALMLKRLEEVSRFKDPPVPAAMAGLPKSTSSPGAAKNAVAALKDLEDRFNHGDTVDALAAEGLDHDAITLRYAAVADNRGWCNEVIRCVEANLRWGLSNESTWVQQAHLLDRAYSANIASAQLHGSTVLIREAIRRYQASAFRSENPGQMEQYNRLLTSLAKRPDPQPLTITSPFVEGNAQWDDKGAGYTVNGVLQIGNCGRDRGGESKRAMVQIQPGTVLTGGTLRASQGELKLLGSSVHPIILRNVTIECDYTASVTASFTIFQQCQLRKSGNWFWNGGFSAKWDLSDCLLINSSFASLGQRDYGIKLRRCTFEQCRFPERKLNDDPKKDGAAAYGADWNKLEDNTFNDCQITPSFLWGGLRSTITDCEVIGTSNFASTKAMIVKIAVGSDDTPFIESLRTATTSVGAGTLTYATQPGVPAKPSSFYRLVGESH